MGRMKEVYMMYYYDNMSVKEIAKELSVDEIAIANLVHNIYFILQNGLLF